MASTKNITNVYESYVEMSFINERNFGGKISPAATVGSFIPCNKVRDFYIDSLIYLHLHASLYYELINFISNNDNDISLFKSCIDQLSIQIINSGHSEEKIGDLNYGNQDSRNKTVSRANFTFDLTKFRTYYNSDFFTLTTTAGYKNYYTEGIKYRKLQAVKPILKNISSITQFTTPPTVTDLYFDTPASGSPPTTTDKYVKKIITPATDKLYTTITDSTYNINYDKSSRISMLEKIIKNILSLDHDKIMSYLLYYTIFYHLVVYNTAIQNEINAYYLHNMVYLNAVSGVANNPPIKTKIESLDERNTNHSAISYTGLPNYQNSKTSVIDLINKFKNDIGSLQSGYLGSGSAEYVDSKSKYADKIGVLNDIKADYDRIQTELNITIKDYNKYIKNFQAVKTYANFVIMVLIVIIIITILVTVLDSITPNFKNYYYVIAFFILSFITFVYYNKFRYINLYERFADVYNAYDYRESLNPTTSTIAPTSSPKPSNNSQCISNTINIDLNSKTDIKRVNSHINFINSILPSLNGYIEATENIMNGLRTNIYTANYGVFAKDGNNYLYNLYIDKKSQNEANRIRKVSLANMLDTMKRHIIYLFNVILLMSILTIILLLGMILFSNFPFYLNYIIILCVILIVVIIIYFINSIVQPTRMIANKNYWANNNPSKYQMAKIA